MGDGGMVSTDDDEINQLAAQVNNHKLPSTHKYLLKVGDGSQSGISNFKYKNKILVYCIWGPTYYEYPYWPYVREAINMGGSGGAEPPR